MIITKTPFRMSFFGGGTDLPEFFNEFGGSVISSTFDKYCYVTVRHLPPFFDYTTELVYSKIERLNKVDEMVHPMVKNTMKYLNMHELRINYESDLPARSGLGTSSSFCVGLLNSFYALKQKKPTKFQLAKDSIYIEREMCQESGGWQDQIAAAFGGFNRIDFKNNEFSVKPINMSEERKNLLNKRLMLFFTGFTRFSSDVQKINLEETREEKNKILKQMLSLVDDAEDVLENENRNLDDFGHLLNKTWNLKRKTGKSVTNDLIDEYYNKAMQAGALGGKLLGAGAGGFLVFYVNEEYQDNVKEALNNLLYVPFKFEDEGSSIVYQVDEFYNLENCREE
ncbi:MAG: hypothetical protein IKP12_04115 [Acholeplasmatales bacterium]|nr:hypothetical protein [Acholeplasmatales bacterium]